MTSEIPVTRRGAERYEKLLETATRLFFENGYEKTGINEIVRASGGSLATVYKWFGNKEELFFAVFERSLKEAREQADALAVATDDPVESMRLAIRAIYSGGFERKFAAFFNAGIRLPLFRNKVFETVMREIYAPTRNRLARLQDRYNVEFALGIDETVQIVLRHIRGTSLEFVLDENDLESRKNAAVEQTLSVLLALTKFSSGTNSDREIGLNDGGLDGGGLNGGGLNGGGFDDGGLDDGGLDDGGLDGGGFDGGGLNGDGFDDDSDGDGFDDGGLDGGGFDDGGFDGGGLNGDGFDDDSDGDGFDDGGLNSGGLDGDGFDGGGLNGGGLDGDGFDDGGFDDGGFDGDGLDDGGFDDGGFDGGGLNGDGFDDDSDGDGFDDGGLNSGGLDGDGFDGGGLNGGGLDGDGFDDGGFDGDGFDDGGLDDGGLDDGGLDDGGLDGGGFDDDSDGGELGDGSNVSLTNNLIVSANAGLNFWTNNFSVNLVAGTIDRFNGDSDDDSDDDD